jgi:hypothetical protein
MAYSDENIWEMVCGSAWETNSWWWAVDYDGGDWDDPCTLWVAIADPDNDYWFEDGVITATVTVTDIRRAIQEMLDHPVIEESFRKSDFDAIYGDAVIQQAIFGEVIYG